MRVLIGTIIFLIVLMGFGFYSQARLTTQSNDLIVYVNTIENQAQNENWLRAENELVKFEKKWNRIHNNWDLVIEHHEMDTIDEAVAKLKKYLAVRNLDLTLAELSIIKHFLLHIPTKERFNLQNIL